jgi:hypothetical protein
VTWFTFSSLSAKQNEAVTGGLSHWPVLGSVVLRKATCGLPVAVSVNPHKVVGQHELVGQFRSAGGLVLPSGRKLGPQISCRSRVTLVG